MISITSFGLKLINIVMLFYTIIFITLGYLEIKNLENEYKYLELKNTNEKAYETIYMIMKTIETEDYQYYKKNGIGFDQILKITNKLNCLEDLYSAERNGAKINLECGSTSGLIGVGQRANQLLYEIRILNERLVELKTRFY